jgi:hypothetical protein
MIGKPLAKLTKREKTQLIKLEMKKGVLQQIATKFTGLSGDILKTYIPINWKIGKKWIHF